MRTRTAPAAPAAPEPQYRPAQAWPGMPAPPAPIRLAEDVPEPEPTPEPAPRTLDLGTIREILALLLLLAGATLTGAAAFMISAVVGLFVLGGVLLVVGLLLGIT